MFKNTQLILLSPTCDVFGRNSTGKQQYNAIATSSSIVIDTSGMDRNSISATLIAFPPKLTLKRCGSSRQKKILNFVAFLLGFPSTRYYLFFYIIFINHDELFSAKHNCTQLTHFSLLGKELSQR